MERLLPQSGRPRYSASRDAAVKDVTVMIGTVVGNTIKAQNVEDVGKKKKLKDFKYILSNDRELSIEVEIKKTTKVVVDDEGFPSGGAHIVGKKRLMEADLLVQYIPKSQTVWITDKNTLLNAPIIQKNTTYEGEGFTQREDFLEVSKEHTDVYHLEDGKLIPVPGHCNHNFLRP
jgi:phosphohistidine swiveling domain-containing protein